MCSPTAIAATTMAVTKAGTTALQIKQQNEMAEYQAEAAANAAEMDYELLEQQREQITDQANREKFEKRRQALRKQSKLRAAFGESNVLGNSPLRQMHDAMMQAEYDVGIIESGREDQISQNLYEREAVHAQAKSRYNQAKGASTSGWMSGLKIGMSGAQGGMQGYSAAKTMGLGESSMTVSSSKTNPAPYGIGPQ